MNEKIRKFAEEAGLRFTMLTSNPMIPFVDGRQQDLEKFAELILEEAMDIVRDEVSFFSDWACADAAIKKVNEHFGIE